MFQIFLILGWLIAAALGSWSLLSPWRTARRDYTYDVEEAAHYAVIAPVSWSLSLCWIIFACFTNHGGIQLYKSLGITFKFSAKNLLTSSNVASGVVNKFLSSYWMTLFSRISYAVYLCQFAIFFYNVGTTRYSTEFQILRLVSKTI